MSLRRVVRPLAALLPLALLVPAAAHAERVVVHDAEGDVARFDEAASEAAGTDVTRPAPADRSTDITRVVIDHEAEALTVTISVRKLRNSYYDGAFMQLRSQKRLWGVTLLRSGTETYTTLTRGHRENERTCGGLLTSVDTSADRIVTTIPTSCIEDPRWVRVGVALLSVRLPAGSVDEADAAALWDEAGVTGFESDHVDVRGPKIHRG